MRQDGRHKFTARRLEESSVRGLNGKRVLITGGAGGIGTATARRFLDEGARVAVIDRDEAACRRIEKALPALDGILRADVARAESVARAFEELDARLGGLDVLINNAGVSIRHPFKEITPEQWKKVLDINLFGV